MPEITQELHDALRKMAATAIVEEGDDDALVAASVEIRLLRAVLRAIDADPAFATRPRLELTVEMIEKVQRELWNALQTAPPVQSWQERAAKEIARRYHGELYEERGGAETELRQHVLAVLAESAPCASDPEERAALLRLVRAVDRWINGRDAEQGGIRTAYTALPASVREEVVEPLPEPPDDEPLTAADEAAIQKGAEDIAAGRGLTGEQVWAGTSDREFRHMIRGASEAHAALLRLVRAVETWATSPRSHRGPQTPAERDMILARNALPASVREEAGL